MNACWLGSSPPSPQDELLAGIVRRLANVYQPERIYLLGSTARGDADADSDYDVVVEVADDAPISKLSPGLGYAAVEGLARNGDSLIWPRGRFESRLHLKASLPWTVLREGRLLYAA